MEDEITSLEHQVIILTDKIAMCVKHNETEILLDELHIMTDRYCTLMSKYTNGEERYNE